LSPQTRCNLLFRFTRDGDRWECRPSELWGQIGLACFASGAGLVLFMATPFLSSRGGLPGRAFGLLFVLGAGMLAWGAWRYWRLRRVPLSVEKSGRITYGEQELCPARSVRSVQIIPDPQAEHGDCKLVLECADASRLELPGPFFGSVSDRDSARVLGRELAEALRVDVVEVG
jgi:hypothetical protein